MTKKNVFKGDLIVKNDTVCDYTEVTGSVSVYGSAKLDAPKLETVGGYVSVSGSAKLDAPKLKTRQLCKTATCR